MAYTYNSSELYRSGACVHAYTAEYKENFTFVQNKNVMLFAMEPLSKQISEKNFQRRSQRVMIDIPISVELTRPGEKPVLEETDTLVINANGVLVLLTMRVAVGDPVTLRNPKTGEQQPCRVVYLGPQQLEKQEIGIEFVKPSPLFWRITFPSPDWTPRSEDAKGLKKTSLSKQKPRQQQ